MLVSSYRFVTTEKSMKAMNGFFEFRGYGTVPAKCHVCIQPVENKILVTMTEIAQNPGTSIYNAAEELAAAIYTQYSLHNRDVRWIQATLLRSGEWLIQEVVFEDTVHDGESITFARPNWSRLSYEEVSKIAGFPGLM